MPTETLIVFPGLKDRGVRYCRLHINRLVAAGQFPAPVRLSANRIAWRASEIDAWIASRPTRGAEVNDVTD